MKKYQIVSAVLALITIFAVFAVFLININKNKVILTKNAEIEAKTEKYQALEKKYYKLKSSRLSKYSAANLNQSSMNAKNNINSFFAAINNWNGDTYTKRAENAKKYATNEVIITFVGGTFKSSSIKKQAKSLKDNNTTKKLLKTDWYIEKTTGNNVKGLAIVTTLTNVQGANSNKQQQLYQVTYNVPGQKITKATPVDLSSNNTINFGD